MTSQHRQSCHIGITTGDIKRDRLVLFLPECAYAFYPPLEDVCFKLVVLHLWKDKKVQVAIGQVRDGKRNYLPSVVSHKAMSICAGASSSTYKSETVG